MPMYEVTISKTMQVLMRITCLHATEAEAQEFAERQADAITLKRVSKERYPSRTHEWTQVHFITQIGPNDE